MGIGVQVPQDLLQKSTIMYTANGETYFVHNVNIFRSRPYLAKFAKTKPNKPLCVIKITKNAQATGLGVIYSKRKTKKEPLPIRCKPEPITKQDIDAFHRLRDELVKFFEENVGILKNITAVSVRPEKVTRKLFTQVIISPAIEDEYIARDFMQLLFGHLVEFEKHSTSRLLVIDIPLKYKLVPEFNPDPSIPITRGKKEYKYNLVIELKLRDGSIITRTASIVISKKNSVHVSFSQPASYDLTPEELERLKRVILEALWRVGVIKPAD